MPTSTPQGTPYVIPTDAVGQYPEISHSLADRVDAVDNNANSRVARAGDTMTGPLIVPGLNSPRITFENEGWIGTAGAKMSWYANALGNIVHDVYANGAWYVPTLRQSPGGGEINQDSHIMFRLNSGQVVHVDRTWFQLWLNQGMQQAAEPAADGSDDLEARLAVLEARVAQLENPDQ